MSRKCPEKPIDDDQCSTGSMLHDRLSLMWGEHKDEVDALTMIMMKNQYEFTELKTNLNSQIDVLKTAKTRLNELLAEARANLAADNEELKQKYQQKEELDTQYVEFMRRCKKEISGGGGVSCGLFCICSYISVRNAVHESSTVCGESATASGGQDFLDCDMASWVPSECSVSCDDSCDPAKPYICGGWQQMRRDVVVRNNTCGHNCQRETLMKRCGQYKCPVNCEMSEWSGWSKCTAVCNGGVQGRTRSIVEKPKNGGTSCNTVEDQQACGTISCDRNCMLAGWTGWTPCSMACSGGFKERFRHVAIPTRGFGRCPDDNSHFRYQKTQCNEQACRGDEICVAKQDLVIAIDGSGSVGAPGFEILKRFVKKLLDKYETQYWGDYAVKIGIVAFGNGIIMSDGKTVSPAITAKPLSFTMDEVQSAVAGLPFKKGFTNMAQAFSAAETAFMLGSRRAASSAVMVITDGKPSFNFMTNEMVEQLDDKGITRYFLLVNQEDLQSNSNAMMLSWASQPWETNVVHVPGGLELLDSDPELWVEKVLVKFCPMAYSPADMMWEEISYGYAHVMDGGYCGTMSYANLLATDTQSAETCAALVSGAGGQSFILGVSWARGKCYMGSEDVVVTMAQFTTWQENRITPQCPDGTTKSSSTLYDFYAMEPAEPDAKTGETQER
jgi:hypothetical protein